MGLEYTGNNNRLRKEMKDFPSTPIEQAIMELYKWYQDHKSFINKELLQYDK